MFGFLAAFGPVGVAAAVIGTVGTVAYGALKDDEYENTTYSNKSEKEAEAREDARADKKKRIKQEIKAYKKQQIKRLKEKYNVDAEFNSDTKDSVVDGIVFNSPVVKQDVLNKSIAENIKIHEKDGDDNISILENETKEIIKLIEKLEAAKYEAIS